MVREEIIYDSSHTEDRREEAMEEDMAVEESTDNDSILSEESFHPFDRYTHPIHR